MKQKLYASCLLIFLATPHSSHGYTAEEFNWIPYFLQQYEKPSVSIVFDNSESMTSRFHGESFDPAKEFAGYFDPKAYYAYRPMRHGPCFIPDKEGGEWSGNFLNWATTTRLDAARKALTGGNYDSNTGCFVGSGLLTTAPVAEYDDSAPVRDLNGQFRYMTPHRQHLTFSSITGDGHVLIESEAVNERYALHIAGMRGRGVLQAFGHKARFALFVFDGGDGGKLVCPMSDDPENLQAIEDRIDSADVTTGSPLAETLHTVSGYLRQDAAIDSDIGPRYTAKSYVPSQTTDPYHFPVRNLLVPCTRQSVILVTDGVSSQDLGIPADVQGLVGRPRPESEYQLSKDGSTYLMDTAYKWHTSDLRPEDGMEGDQSFSLFAVCVSGRSNALLKDAVKFGNFSDLNGNNLPDLKREYDADGDGITDGYFEGEPGTGIEAAMTRAFLRATVDPAAGKATATGMTLSPNGRSNESALYQTVFFPPSADTQQAPAWSGQIHAYFVDAKGNLREDTDADGRLDMAKDRVIEFEGDTIFAYSDLDGDGIICAAEKNATALTSMLDIRFPWSTSPWLNSLSDIEATIQRNNYASPVRQRHIFTFVDTNRNMIPDIGEIQDFALEGSPSSLHEPDKFYNYLTLYESQPGGVGFDLSKPIQQAIDDLRRNDQLAFNQFLAALAKRQVDFIRGAEIGNATICGIPDSVRSRNISGTTWRLGDILNSSPVAVGRPAENYHLIYGDKTYEAFVKKYANRRKVIYAGANDGMLHAFNADFTRGEEVLFDSAQEGRATFPPGMELWAYIPYNLLPHLKWLMRPDYGKELHAAYMDLKPRVFDARIFFGLDGVTPLDNARYPNGWGTVLVAGMRMGGAEIKVDIDKTDGNSFNPEIDRTTTSAYVIMDITDPEQPPVLLGEIAMPCQGFTTCRPAVMPKGPSANPDEDKSRWYLVFGSGPAATDGSATSNKLSESTSDQAGRIFVVDLNALVAERIVRSVGASEALSDTLPPLATLEQASFVSEPIAFDLDLPRIHAGLSLDTDVVYFGTVSGGKDSSSGKVWRLRTQNSSPANWTVSPLMDVGQPVSAAPTVALDENHHPWVYFGTGRLFDREDIACNAARGFFGIREPEIGGSLSWGVVQFSELFDSTDVSSAFETVLNQTKIEQDSDIRLDQESAPASRDDLWLKNEIANAGGWKIGFLVPGERILTQAAVVGGMVTFTSHVPNMTPCYRDGDTSYWGLDYETGTNTCPKLLENKYDNDSDPLETAATPFSLPISWKTSSNQFQMFFQTSSGKIRSVLDPVTAKARSKIIFWSKNFE